MLVTRDGLALNGTDLDYLISLRSAIYHNKEILDRMGLEAKIEAKSGEEGSKVAEQLNRLASKLFSDKE